MKYWVALAPIKDPRCPNGAPSLGKCRATLSPKLDTIIHHPTPKSKPPPDALRDMPDTLTLAVLRLLLAALGAEATLGLA